MTNQTSVSKHSKLMDYKSDYVFTMKHEHHITEDKEFLSPSFINLCLPANQCLSWIQK